MARPRTIHDFYGFPRELFEVQYPARGSPELAQEVAEIVKPTHVGLDEDSWGIDHGTWSVLVHAFPKGDVPVVQLSIHALRDFDSHLELGASLAPLRERGVLIVGSGNIVHNLHTYAWGKHGVEPFDWAIRFDELVREHIVSDNHEPLINYETIGRDALLAAPTPDHYLPLLYILGLKSEGEKVSFPVEGFDGGSISMTAVRIG